MKYFDLIKTRRGKPPSPVRASPPEKKATRKALSIQRVKLAVIAVTAVLAVGGILIFSSSRTTSRKAPPENAFGKTFASADQPDEATSQEQAGEKEKHLKRRRSTHQLCLNCHLALQSENRPGGPVDCMGCHPGHTHSVAEMTNIPRPDCESKERILIVTDGGRMAPVPFDHKAHIAASRSCSDCHHKNKAPESCNKCHTLAGIKEGEFVTIVDAYHKSGSSRSCLGCHEQETRKPDCAGCHHLRMTGLAASSCATCHTGKMESLDQAARLPAPSTLFVPGMTNEFQISILSDEYKPAKMKHKDMADKLTEISNNSRLSKFFHKKETTICAGCHHSAPVEKNQKVPACSACHTSRTEPTGDKPALLGAYHLECLGCHKKMGHPEAKMPQACAGCHKDGGVKSSETLAQPQAAEEPLATAQDLPAAPSLSPIEVKTNATLQAERPMFITIPPMLEPLDRAPVMFPHDKHTAAMKEEGCKACHPRRADRFRFSFPEQLDTSSRSTLVDSYHNSCIRCHTRRAAEHKTTGPATCGECHANDNNYIGKEYLPLLPQEYESSGKMANYSGNVHRMDQKTFHVTNENRIRLEWSVVTFDYYVHDKHARAMTNRCDVCHYRSLSLKQKLTADARNLSPRHKAGDTAKSCTKCHAFTGELPNAKCESCHTMIKERQLKGTGYHGTLKGACVQCHKEHLKKPMSIVTLDQKTFDHRLASFQQTGKHSKLECDECHKKKRSKDTPGSYYIGLKYGLCTDCHRDPHNAQFKAPCEKCHSTDGWKKPALKFDHNTDSTYKLLGKHAAVDCSKCHKPATFLSAPGSARFKGLPAGCVDCHKDPHRGQFKAACDTCHSPAGWQKEFLTFDHNRNSKYPLVEKHAEAACNKCHLPAFPGEKLGFARFTSIKTGCADCHKDPHRGQYEQNCVRCHTKPTTWKLDKTQFNHDTATKYPLAGKHAGVDCIKCHKPKLAGAPLGTAQFRGVSTKCDDCHKVKHPETYGPVCLSCHTPNGWPPKMASFEHRPKLELPGKHLSIPCSACHNEKRMACPLEPGKIKYECVTCHKADDKHKGTLGNDCAKCHTSSGWKEPWLLFNHNTMTRYILDRDHKNVACVKCHADNRWKPLETACESCHPKFFLQAHPAAVTNIPPPASPPRRPAITFPRPHR